MCICCSTIICKEKGSSNFKRKVPARLHCFLKPSALQSTETICSRGAGSEIKKILSWEKWFPKKAEKEKIMRGNRGVCIKGFILLNKVKVKQNE